MRVTLLYADQLQRMLTTLPGPQGAILDTLREKLKDAMIKLVATALFVLATSVPGMASAGLLLGQAPDPSLIVEAGGYEWVCITMCESPRHL